MGKKRNEEVQGETRPLGKRTPSNQGKPRRETREDKGGHTIEHRHACGKTTWQTMGGNEGRGESEHTFQDRQTCGEKLGRNE